MNQLLSYSGITTKIRAMKSCLLDESAYRELASLTSVQEAVTFLKRHPGYKDLFSSIDESALHRGDIEKLLYNTIFTNFTKIYKFCSLSQRKYMDLYFRRYEVNILKTCLRMVFDHRNDTLDLSIYKEFFEKHSKVDIINLSASSSISEYVDNLKGTDYYPILSKLDHITLPTLFDYEMALDLYYFQAIWNNKDKVLAKKDLEIITQDQGCKLDILNIQWIHRSKKYYDMSSAEIYALLIPVNYKLKKQETIALVEAPNKDEFMKVLKTTYYAKQYSDLTTESLDDLYVEIRDKIHNTHSRRYPYSIATINSYLYYKEHEIDKITTALECIRYRVEPSSIMEFLK